MFAVDLIVLSEIYEKQMALLVMQRSVELRQSFGHRLLIGKAERLLHLRDEI